MPAARHQLTGCVSRPPHLHSPSSSTPISPIEGWPIRTLSVIALSPSADECCRVSFEFPPDRI